MLRTTDLINTDIMSFDFGDGFPIIAFGLKFVIAVFLIGYVFFSLFLYLRIRILSMTLTTPNSGLMRYISLLHFFAVLGLALFLGLLLLF